MMGDVFLALAILFCIAALTAQYLEYKERYERSQKEDDWDS
jgi:hypothetical protein